MAQRGLLKGEWNAAWMSTAFSPSSSDGAASLFPPLLLTWPTSTVSVWLFLGSLLLLSFLALPIRLRQCILRRLHHAVSAVLDVVVWQCRLLLAALHPLCWLSGFSSTARSPHPHPVYLLDVSTFTAPPHWRVSSERFRRIAGGNFRLPATTVDFCSKIIAKSGLGEETAFPRRHPSTHCTTRYQHCNMTERTPHD